MSSINERERGSASIEAAISLVFFLFVIMSVYMLVNFCVVQARISYAIDTTAKEMSQYSYFYHVLGLEKIDGMLGEKKQQAASTYNAINTAVTSGGKTISAIKDNPQQSLNNILSGESTDDLNKLAGQIKGASNSISEAVSSPKEFVESVAALAGQKAWSEAKSHLVAAPLAKSMTRRHFGETKDLADQYLRGHGVVDGYNGLDFTASKLFENGSEDIEIIVIYTVKLPEILHIDRSVTICQRARTRGWLGGDNPDGSASGDQEDGGSDDGE